MVVRVENCKTPSKMRNFVGNNIQLDIFENVHDVTVTGNNCIIDISNHFGTLKVLGNNSRVTIINGYGAVTLIGNNGKVTLSTCDQKKSLSCTGNNFQIITRNNEVSRPRPTKEQHSEKPSCVSYENSSDSTVNISNVDNIHLYHTSRRSAPIIRIPKIPINISKLVKNGQLK